MSMEIAMAKIAHAGEISNRIVKMRSEKVAKLLIQAGCESLTRAHNAVLNYERGLERDVDIKLLKRALHLHGRVFESERILHRYYVRLVMENR